jgi:hypothetical protein
MININFKCLVQRQSFVTVVMNFPLALKCMVNIKENIKIWCFKFPLIQNGIMKSLVFPYHTSLTR